MGLINTWNAALADNAYFREDYQLPAVRSTRNSVCIWLSYYWYTTTITTARFAYAGMTQGCAEDCQAAMVALYTKQKALPSYNETGQSIDAAYVSECVADIKTTHKGGLMWRVDVEVNEKDITIEPISYTPDP